MSKGKQPAKAGRAARLDPIVKRLEANQEAGDRSVYLAARVPADLYNAVILVGRQLLFDDVRLSDIIRYALRTALTEWQKELAKRSPER